MEVLKLDALKKEFDLDNAEIVNRGGTAHVSRIAKLSTGTIYALKTVYKGHSAQRNTNIKREKLALESLDHHNIVKLFAVYEDDRDVHFLLPWMSSDLFQWACVYHEKYNGMQGLPEDSCRFYGAELCSALEYMRSRGFVHRDIKCENVLLTADYHIKLSDFGTSKYIMDKQGRVRREMNTYVGTHNFMAPEVMNNGPVTYATDLWGLANVLSIIYYTCWVCDRDEERDHSDGEYYARINRGDFTFPGRRYNAHLQQLIMKLTKYYPSMRLGANRFLSVKSHPYFKDMDWDMLQHYRPPNLTEIGVANLIDENPDRIPPLAREEEGYEPDAQRYADSSIFNSPTYKQTREQQLQRDQERRNTEAPRARLFQDEQEPSPTEPSFAYPGKASQEGVQKASRPRSYCSAPQRQVSSLESLSASPQKREASPQRREASPQRREASPQKREASPQRREAPPPELRRNVARLLMGQSSPRPRVPPGGCLADLMNCRVPQNPDGTLPTVFLSRQGGPEQRPNDTEEEAPNYEFDMESWREAFSPPPQEEDEESSGLCGRCNCSML